MAADKSKLTIFLHDMYHRQTDDNDLKDHLVRQMARSVLGGAGHSRCCSLVRVLAEHAQVEVVQCALTDLLHKLCIKAEIYTQHAKLRNHRQQ